MSSLLLYNGFIETMATNVTGRDSQYDSLVIKRGTITALGKALQNRPEYSNLKKLNLKRATVYPGFVDAHTHFHYFAKSLLKANLSGCATLGDALKKLIAHTTTLKQGEWLLGAGLLLDETSQSNWEAATALDSITGSRPAAILTRDHHTLWVNSKALQLAGIDKSTTSPTGGKIEKLPNGPPSGILRENSAMDLVLNCIPSITKKRENELYDEALKIAHQQGVTGVHSFDSSHAFEFFMDKSKKKRLGLRITYYIQPPDIKKIKQMIGESLLFGYGNDWLRIAGMKIFSDGALGSRTALTHQPYKNSKGNKGIEVTSPKELRKLISIAKNHSLSCAIHAIGDKAVTNCIEALAEFPAEKIATKARHRIEHLQMLRRKDIPTLKRSGIIASMQPSHLPGDVKDIQACWGKREKSCYVFKTLLNNEIPLAFGSDVPIVELNPLEGIKNAFQRRSSDGKTILNPAERITPHQAAYCFTRGAAYAAGEEDYSGSILPGYRADLTILSHNLRKVNLTTVSDTSVLATIIAGKIVYSDSSF